MSQALTSLKEKGRLLQACFICFPTILILNIALSNIDLNSNSLLAMFCGWFLADFASGVIHMLLDYIPCNNNVDLDKLFFYHGDKSSAEYKALRKAIFSRISYFQQILYDFKVHHPNPSSLGRRDIVYQIGSTVQFVSLPLSTLFLFLISFYPLSGFITILFNVFLIGVTFSQYFHGMLHTEEKHIFISILRKTRLIMTPQMHNKHHLSLKEDFSVINGWLKATMPEQGVFTK